MTRDVRLYLVGSLVLVLLAGCGRNFFAQREVWRREAEVQCLKSGAVKEGPALTMMSPIEGPGICGADFPFKVAGLGDTQVLGYADEPVRPPGAIRGGSPRTNPPSPTYSDPSRPLDLRPAGRSPSIDSAPLPPPDPRAGGLPAPPRNPAYGESVPISPSREAEAPTPSLAASLTPPATLACPVVSALDRWVADAIQPAAQRWFGQPVIEIKQISSYSCRGMNGNPYAHISEHAFGNALDIAGFVLADGHVITVRRGWAGTPEEQGFLRDIQSAAATSFRPCSRPAQTGFTMTTSMST